MGTYNSVVSDRFLGILFSRIYYDAFRRITIKPFTEFVLKVDMKMVLMIMTFIRKFREYMMEPQEKNEEIGNVWRRFFIEMAALSIWFLSGLILFGTIDYVFKLVLG